MLFQVNFAKKSRRNAGMLIVLSTCGQRETINGTGLRQSPRCHQPQRRLSGGQLLSRKLVCGSSGGTGTAQHLRCQIRQVEYRRFAHSAAKVAVSGVYVHQKAVWHPERPDEPLRRGYHRQCL